MKLTFENITSRDVKDLIHYKLIKPKLRKEVCKILDVIKPKGPFSLAWGKKAIIEIFKS